MDQDFLDVNNSGHKKIFFLFIIILALLIAFGYFFVFGKYFFRIKTVHLELGEEISSNINDYLRKKVVDTSGYVLDTSNVDNTSVGEYKYQLIYNGKKETGKIIVEDTKAPVYELKEITIEENDEDFYIGDVLSSCNDMSKPCIVSYMNDKDEEKLNKVGNYTIKIKIADVYGNYEKADAKINVVAKGSLLSSDEDLEYASSSEDLDDFKNDYYIKLDKPIQKESIESTGHVDEISMIDWEKYAKDVYPNYTFKDVSIISIYNKSGYIIGYAVDLCLSGINKESCMFVTKKVDSSYIMNNNETETAE